MAEFDIDKWLNAEVRPGETRLHRICFLIYAQNNQPFAVRGVISYGGGHQSGLTVEDGQWLDQVTSFISGLQAAGVPIMDVVKTAFSAYAREVEASEQPESVTEET